MATSREKTQIAIAEKSSVPFEENHSESENRHPYLVLVEDIFFRPHFAFESFLNTEDLGGKDLFKLHFLLSLTAPLGLIIHNIIVSLFGFFLYREEIEVTELVSGSLKAWAFFFAMVVLIRFADIFRLYYKFWDRHKNWEPPPPWILMIGFIPFTASGLFLVFPMPISLAFVSFSFLYSLHLSFQALQNVGGYSNKDFFGLIIQYLIFLSMITGIILGIFNIYRTSLS